MALVIADRVRETTVTSGTADIALGGAVTGFQSFAVIGNNNTTYYCIAGQGTNEWEVGIGTYISGTNTLQRTTVLSNSSGTAPSKINFLAGTKDVFVTYPASKSVDTDTAQTLSNKTIASGVINSTTIGASTPSTGAFTSLSSTSTTTLNGTTIPASKTLVDTDSSQTLTNKTFGSGTSISTDQPSVISVNSTSAALRITQTGAGNALLVEDSANPDATPFVVGADGDVVIGATAAQTFPSGDGVNRTASVQSQGSSFAKTTIAAALYNTAASVGGATLSLSKSNSATVGSHAVVANGDVLGVVSFNGSDGTNFVRAATIISQVDGTPGTSDMPGRLVFSTTADGASSPTERMRIGSAGNVGIGASAEVMQTLRAGKNITGNAFSSGIVSNGQVQSDVTSRADYFQAVTSAASGTYANIYGYQAQQGTFTGTVTNQMGFTADPTLIGATNNYGFYSNIASGTGRWNFYANGTAANYFGGIVGIGVAPNKALDVNGQLRIRNTATSGYALLEYGASATATNNWHVGSEGDGSFRWYNGTFGSGIERMRIDSSGNVSIGASSTTYKLQVTGSGAMVNSYVAATDGSATRLGLASSNRTWTITNWGTQFAPNGTLAFADETAPAVRMVIDTAGNVGIGTATPTRKLDVYGQQGLLANTTEDRHIKIGVGRTGNGYSYVDLIGDATYTDFGFRIIRDNTGADANSYIQHRGTGVLSIFAQEAGTIALSTNSQERMRINSTGTVMVGTTTTDPIGANTGTGCMAFGPGASGDALNYFNTNNVALKLGRGSDGDIVIFYRNTTSVVQVGSISVTTTATAYNTSSDYRLKNVEGELTNSGSYIDSLRPVHGTWKADGSKFIGLIAHEVQEVSQTKIVTGEKDGVEMQAMDYSSAEIIANLIAEVQSLRKRVAQLEGA